MRAIWCSLLGGVTLWSQTVRLRYGEIYRVTNVSSSTPAVVTVVRHMTGEPTHDLANGDLVYFYGISGCRDANGYRKVANANPSAGTFTLTDLSDNPISCTYPFQPEYASGLGGKVVTLTLRSMRPRILLPGSGALLERSKDPDGSGPEVAPVVTENGPAWQRIMNTVNPSPGCDGITPALCPNEEARVAGASSQSDPAYYAVAAAYAWFADNSKTGHLNYARYMINHMHRYVVGTTGTVVPFGAFPCDSTAAHCALGSGADWISIALLELAMAYDLIRDQMSESERQAFADKMLNGWEGRNCTNALQKQEGFASLTSGSKTVTGSGFSAYAVGDWVYFKTAMNYGGVGRWGQVTGVASDNEMTVNFVVGTSKAAPSDVTVSNVDHFKVFPWQSGQCGAHYIANGHAASLGGIIPRGPATLASAISSTDTVITVANPGNFTDPPPFWAGVDGEIMRVTAVAGNQLTVERGQAYSTAASHGAKPLGWIRQLNGYAPVASGPQSFWGGSGNVAAQKAVDSVLTGFALAGDDPRATELLERSWNLYYDWFYPVNKDYWSGPTQGGTVNVDYVIRRWHMTHLPVYAASRFAFADGNVDLFGPHFWYALKTVFLWVPPADMNGNALWNHLPIDPSAGDAYNYYRMAWACTASTLDPSNPMVPYANYWFWNLAGLGWVGNYNAAVVAAYCPTDATKTDFRQVLDPWEFHTTSEGNPSHYFGILVSKTDWTTSAGMVVAGLGMNWPQDHQIDQGVYLPGQYAIFKGGRLLLGGSDSGYGFGGGDTGINWFEIGGGRGSLRPAGEPWYPPNEGGIVAQIDRRHADANYVYARGNHTQAFRSSYGVTRAHRHVLHIKGSVDHVVVFDDSVTSAPQQRRTRLYYHRSYDAASDFSANPDYTAITFRKPTGQAAMISTRVLFPDGSSPTRTYARTTNSDAITYDWGSVGSAQMIAMHRVALGTDDAMPTVEELEADDGSVGFEVLDENGPFAVVLPKNGERNQCGFRVTFSAVGGIYVVGLLPGRYRVYQDGQEVAGSPFTVEASDGTLYFSGTAGSYMVSGTPPAELGVWPESLNFQYQRGGALPPAQSFTASCTGGACVATVSVGCGWVSVDPGSGGTPATFQVAVNPEGLAEGTYTCPITVSALALGSPKEVSVLLEVAPAAPEPLGMVTQTLPTGTVNTPYQFALEARGGQPPYQWWVRSGALPLGLALSSGGELSGTPRRGGVTEFELSVGDAEGAVESRGFTLTIQPEVQSSALEAAVVGATSDRLLIRYGKRGLAAGETCTWEASESPEMTAIQHSGTDQGGGSRRSAVVGGTGVLAPDRAYYVRVRCGSESVVTMGKTRPAGTAQERTIKLSANPPAGVAADRIRLEYGYGPELGQQLTASCGARCELELRVPSGQMLYYRYAYLRADGSLVSRSRVQVMAVE